MRILIINDPCGRPYLVRYTLGSLFGRELKLHVMLRSDYDRALHDHPWGFWSLVLAGGYDEHTETGVIPRDAGALAYRRAEWKHRVMLRPCACGQKHPWPVRLLQWLERRCPRVAATPRWHAALMALESQVRREEHTCVTLVLTTKRTRVWGFWPQGRFEPHTVFKPDVEC